MGLNVLKKKKINREETASQDTKSHHVLSKKPQIRSRVSIGKFKERSWL